MGVPTDVPQENERYSATFKMYTSGGGNSEFRIQYHRFESDSPLHPLLKTVPHVAFKVESIEAAIKDKEVVLGPYEPIPGYKVAAIVECGVPIEFIETTLTEEQIWYGDHSDTLIYPTIV